MAKILLHNILYINASDFQTNLSFRPSVILIYVLTIEAMWMEWNVNFLGLVLAWGIMMFVCVHCSVWPTQL